MLWTPDHSTQRVALEVSSLRVWLWACPDKCQVPHDIFGIFFLGQCHSHKGRETCGALGCVSQCCHCGTCEGKRLPGCNGLAPHRGDSQQGATAALVSLSQQHLLRSPRKTAALVIHASAVTIPPLIHPTPVACSQMFLAGSCKMCPGWGQDWASWLCTC